MGGENAKTLPIHRGCYGGRRGEKNKTLPINRACYGKRRQKKSEDRKIGRKIQYVQNGSKPQRVGWQIGNFPIICAGTNFRKIEQNSRNLVSTKINSLAIYVSSIYCSSWLIEYILLYLISLS